MCGHIFCDEARRHKAGPLLRRAEELAPLNFAVASGSPVAAPSTQHPYSLQIDKEAPELQRRRVTVVSIAARMPLCC